VKAWRVLHESRDEFSEPLPAAEVVARMLADPSGTFWLESADGRGAFAEDVADVRSLLLASHLREVAAAWLGRNGSDGSGWVFSFVFGLDRDAAVDAVEVVRALVAEASTEQEFASIGAGPLEALLRRRGPEVISAVEVAASQDARFRVALAGVWPSEQHPDVWERWRLALRGREVV